MRCTNRIQRWPVLAIALTALLIWSPAWAVGVLTPAANPPSVATGSSLNVVERYGAKADGIADDTAAINSAIAAAGAQDTIYLPKGTYKITSELLISSDRVRLVGDGVNLTILDFQPTANGSLIRVSNGAAINFQGRISGMTLTSQDTTYTKIALDIWDVSEMQIEDISIAGNNGYWRGNNSVGLKTHGREFTTVKNVTIFAEYPLMIADNPNHTIDIDHFHFEDIYLAGYAGTPQPLITINSGVNLSDVTFDGAQAWVGGAGGLYWNDTTSTIASYGLTIKNVRTEQTANSSSWAIYLGRNQSLYNLRIENLYVDPNTNGIYMRNVFGGTLDNYTYTSHGVALDYNGTNWGLDARGCWFLGGSTANITGQNLVHAGQKYPVDAPLPSAFRLHNAALATQTTFTSTGMSQPILTLANNGLSNLGFGTMTGVITVTTSAGDSALFAIAGAAHTVAEISDPGNKFSTTLNTATSTNVYWDAGSARYQIQNKSGGSLNYSIMLLGAYEGF